MQLMREAKMKEKTELLLSEIRAFGKILEELPIKYMPAVQLFESFLNDKFKDDEVKTDDNGSTDSTSPSKD